MCKMYLINEASSSKQQKKYKCPYCNYKNTRNNLIRHIEDKHEDLIPEGYTPTRVVFNMINKREYGKCMMCGGITNWDEDKGRYDSLCSDKCKADYTNMCRERNLKIYGKENLLDDPDHQAKMLANRSISNIYKFSSGGTLGYVGTYELKFLEFSDKFLHIKCRELLSNYPIIKYMWNEEEHFYLPDYYYVPYNLIIEIKDGGNNPNTRNMEDYRAKQLAKEKAIIDSNEYNYIRLTNNEFEQLLLIFMELKDMYTNEIDIKNNKKIIRVNEDVSPASTALIGMNSNEEIHKDKNYIYFVLSNKEGLSPMLGISKDKTMFNTIFTNDEFKLETHDMTYLQDTPYKIFEYTDNTVEYKYHKFLKALTEGITFTNADIYTWFTGKDLLDSRQILFDEDLKECISLPEKLKIIESSIVATLTATDAIIPMVESTSDEIVIEYAQDINGYYVYNKDTQFRSKSYNTIKDIPYKVINVISDGIL